MFSTADFNGDHNSVEKALKFLSSRSLFLELKYEPENVFDSTFLQVVFKVGFNVDDFWVLKRKQY